MIMMEFLKLVLQENVCYLKISFFFFLIVVYICYISLIVFIVINNIVIFMILKFLKFKKKRGLLYFDFELNVFFIYIEL